MSAHTPGPWVIWHNSIYVAADGPLVVHVLDASLIPDIKAGHFDDVEEPNEADLRLIAAAPDLLEALQTMLALAKGPANGVTQLQKHTAIGLAVVAIERATKVPS